MKFGIFIILLITIFYFELVSSNGCIEKLNSCLGFGTWNPLTRKCNCSDDQWGDFCQFGRKRFIEMSGSVSDSNTNHYFCMSKYMYLIDTQRENVSIRINLETFVTECNWDYLYIFDGKSIYDPLIASLSGIIKENGNDTARTITASSGAAYLYFFSDLNINEEGFNISYRTSHCNNSFCNNHGFCYDNNTCSCNSGWSGSHCSQKICFQDVFNVLSKSKQTVSYLCAVNEIEVLSRASHQSVINDDKMWLYGGFSFNKNNNKTDIKMKEFYFFNFHDNSWSEAATPSFPGRYSHSMVAYGKALIIFGGKTSNDLISDSAWKYEIDTNSWSIINDKSPYGVFGHAAVVVGNTMLVFFGFNREFIFPSTIQKLNLDTNIWSVVQTSGAKVKGRFGHSATYDHQTDVVYIFGGYIVRHLTADLFLYHVTQKKWSVGVHASLPKMLHSGTLVGGNLVIFGGKSYNSSKSALKCYSNELIIYNFDCKSWSTMHTDQLLASKNRYGQSAVYFNNSIYVFGGFNGELRNDIFQISMKGDPSNFKTMESCLSAPLIANYVWSKRSSSCISSDISLPESQLVRQKCKGMQDKCLQYTGCSVCTNAECLWLTNKNICSGARNMSHQEVHISMPEKCKDYPKYLCSLHSSCTACGDDKTCKWNFNFKICLPVLKPEQTAELCFSLPNVTSCENHALCNNCLAGDNNQCMWCESLNQCVNSNAYTVNYMYSQCYEWISGKQNMCKAVNCSSQATCRKCFQHPGCGWCSDGSHTGSGECMEGKDQSPMNKSCQNSLWHFTKCPACYCNGHSQCINGTDTCEKCYGFVTGKHCDTCVAGYYGNPEYNGTCQKCFCNDHYRSCDPSTGHCACDMKGVIGDHCDRCDINANYVGNATDAGICYFVMAFDYHYRSNFTKETKAAFLAKPMGRDVKFDIVHDSGAMGYMNLSLHYTNGYTKVYAQNYMLGYYRISIKEDDYEFDDDDVELRFIVYGWKSSEHFSFKATLTYTAKTFDFVRFLIMFLVCFCGLLILLIILWKLKQRYDICIRNRHEQYELQERINRPCKSINVRLREKWPDKFQKVTPTLIASEDFASGHVGIGTFLIEYPRGEGGLPPPGMSGLAFGSTLITHSSRKTFSQIQQKYSNSNGKRRRKRQRVAEVHL